MPNIPWLDPVAKLLSEIAKIIRLRMTTADVRRMARCIRYGDKIVRRCRELDIQDKELDKLFDRWDKYNN